MEVCIKCRERPGYPTIDNYCERCARDHKLFAMRAIADETEKAWSDYADKIYHVEVALGLRPAPATATSRATTDWATAHDVQGEPAMGMSSTEGGFSSPMKQPVARSKRALTEDDLF